MVQSRAYNGRVAQFAVAKGSKWPLWYRYFESLSHVHSNFIWKCPASAEMPIASLPTFILSFFLTRIAAWVTVGQILPITINELQVYVLESPIMASSENAEMV